MADLLMVSLAFKGHMNPMIKLAERLARDGVHVTIATTEYARGSSLVASPSPDDIDFVFFPDGLGDDVDRNTNIGMLIDSLKENGSTYLYSLLLDLENSGTKFSAVIASPFTPWVPAVASELNLPCAVLWIQACALFSIYYRYFKDTNRFPSLEDPGNTVELPALPVMEVRDLPSFILPHSPPQFRTITEDFFRSLDKVEWVLGNSCYELEEEIVESMADLEPIIPVGPLVSPYLVGQEETPASLTASEHHCIQWLDEKPDSSVIYIAFGSLVELSNEKINSIALALKKAKKDFLWVIRPMERATGVEPLSRLVGEGRGLILEWAPQELVLSHRAVGCFVTHCGWNSTLETVSAGVPVIAYPAWTDQPTNARLLVDVLKIGVRMRDDVDVSGDGSVLRAEEVERCLREVTEGPEAAQMKKRAMSFKKAARKAVEPDGSSHRNLSLFLGEIAGNN